MRVKTSASGHVFLVVVWLMSCILFQMSHASLAKLERAESLEERHEARVLDVAGAPVAVDGEVGEAGGGHVSRAGLVVREAVLVHVTAAVDLQGLRVGLGLAIPNPDPNPDP